MNSTTDRAERHGTISAYTREELERMAALTRPFPFSSAEIEAELERRRAIRAHYERNPELRHA